MSPTNYKALLLIQQSSSPNKKNEILQENSEKKENLKTLSLSSEICPPLLLCRGFCRKFETQNPSTTLPRTRGVNQLQGAAKMRLLSHCQWPRAFMCGLL